MTKGFSTALVLGFFAAIIFLLRFLYGPKGVFRDPKWDAWNEQARIELGQQLDARADEALREEFSRYAESFMSGDEEKDRHLRLKVDHTFRVCAYAGELAASEKILSGYEVSRAIRIAALFHDVGRFEQHRRYHTFADPASCNHGVMGAKVLRAKQFLAKEPRGFQQLVLTTVAAHNRVSIPAAVSGDLRCVLSAVRDADKLDILRIMEEYLTPGSEDNVVLLHLKDEPHQYTASILAALEQGRIALYKDMRYYNDFRILLCSWLYDLQYPSSLRIAMREHHLSGIMQGLSSLPDVFARVKKSTDAILGPRAFSK